MLPCSKNLTPMFALVVTVLSGCAKMVVVKVPASTPAPAEGVIYALPNTVVRVQLKVDRTEKSGAPYAPYAAIFAPDGKPICADQKCTAEKKISYSLQQGATFSTYGEPDPDNVFLVKFAGGGALDQTISMTWDEAGLLSAASSSVTNRTTDVVMSSLKLLAGLGTKAAAGAASVKAEAARCPDDPSAQDAWAIGILGNSGNVAASSTLLTNYCALKKEDRDKLPKDDQLLKNATAAYVARVFPLTTARTQILNATSPTNDPATLLTRIETELNQQLTALYIGTKSTPTWDGTLDVRTIKVGAPLAVLHIDSEDGICFTASEVPPDAKAFPENFKTLGRDQCEKAPALNIEFVFHPAPSNQMFTKITDVMTGERGFRYRIPAQVAVSLSDDKKVYGSGLSWVAQLGTVISLPAERHSKTLSYDLAFVEATGGLKTFKLGTAGGLDSGTVDALSSVGGTLVDYRNAAKKNEDEVSVLTKQDQLLKLRDDICTIQKKYGLTCTIEPQQ
jgi:hypothetical protein